MANTNQYLLTLFSFVFCHTSAYADAAEEKSALLDQLKKAGDARTSYFSEYLLSKSGNETKARLARGENYQFLVEVMRKDAKMRMWCADGQRIFFQLGDETKCVKDAITFMKACNALKKISPIKTNEIQNFEAYMYLTTTDLSIGLGIGNKSSLRSIDDDATASLAKQKDGTIVAHSEEFGTIVLDPSDASIIEQKCNNRTIKRVSHDKKSAATTLAKLVNAMDPAPFQHITLKQFQPAILSIALFECQEIIKQLESGAITIEALRASLEANSSILVDTVIPGLLVGEQKTPLKEIVDETRDEYLAAIKAALFDKLKNQEQVNAYMESDELLVALADRGRKLTESTTASLNQDQKEKLLLTLLHGKIEAKTKQEKEGEMAISDALIRAYLRYEFSQSISRLKRNRKME